MIARIGIALVALVVAAALVLQLRAHDLLENAKHVLVQPRPSAAEVDKQLSGLDTVNDLRPGAQGSLAQAGLQFRLHRYRAAVAAARTATKREPDNFSAWTTLAVALAASGDKSGARLANSRAHALNPFYPAPR